MTVNFPKYFVSVTGFALLMNSESITEKEVQFTVNIEQ